MDFSKALEELKKGNKVKHRGADFYIEKNFGTFFTVNSKCVKFWHPIDSDLMAEDWEIVGPMPTGSGIETPLCEPGEKCDNPTDDKILHDIIKNGFKCDYTKISEEEVANKIDNDIAREVTEKIVNLYRDDVGGIRIKITLNK